MFVLKPMYYILLLRVMLTITSACDIQENLRAWRRGATGGALLFSALFLTSLALPALGYSSKDRCESLAYNPEATLIQAEEKKADFAYGGLLVRSLREFDQLLPVMPVGCSRNIGPNALAGSFLAYFCIMLLLFDPARRTIFGGLIAISVFFLALSWSRGTVVLLIVCSAWFWFSRRPSSASLRRDWANPLFIIIVLCGIVISALAVGGAFDQSVGRLAESVSRVSQYQEAIRLIREHPFSGMGVGYKITHEYGTVYVHNFLLSTWLMMGLLGLLASGAIIAGLLVLLRKALAGPVGDGRFGSAASQAAALLLFPPLLSLMSRSSVESIFLISDWFLLALFITIVSTMRPRSGQAVDPMLERDDLRATDGMTDAKDHRRA